MVDAGRTRAGPCLAGAGPWPQLAADPPRVGFRGRRTSDGTARPHGERQRLVSEVGRVPEVGSGGYVESLLEVGTLLVVVGIVLVVVGVDVGVLVVGSGVEVGIGSSVGSGGGGGWGSSVLLGSVSAAEEVVRSEELDEIGSDGGTGGGPEVEIGAEALVEAEV